MFLKLSCFLKETGNRRKFSRQSFTNYLRLIHVLAQFPFTTSEMARDNQHQILNVLIASRVSKRPKTQYLTKLENFRKISKLSTVLAQCPFSLPKIKIWHRNQRKSRKERKWKGNRMARKSNTISFKLSIKTLLYFIS